jgi:hypothetical protein
MKGYRIAALVIGQLFALSRMVASQVIDLTVNDVGIAIGDKPSMTGLRLNFRDRNLREIKGVNVTIWSPYEPATGRVTGLALGLPATGAKSDDVFGVLTGISGLFSEVATSVNAFARRTPEARATPVQPRFNFATQAPWVIGGLVAVAAVVWIFKKL